MSFLFGDSDDKGDKAWACFGSDNPENDDKTSTSQDSLFNFNSESVSCNNQEESIFKTPSVKTSVSGQIQGKTLLSPVQGGIVQESSTKTPQKILYNSPPTQHTSSTTSSSSSPAKKKLCLDGTRKDGCSPVSQVMIGQESNGQDRIGSGGDTKETSGWEIHAGRKGMDKQEADRTVRNSQEVGNVKMCGVEDKTLTSSGVGSMFVSSETSGVSGLLKELMKEQQNKMRDLVVEVELEENKTEELVASMEQIVMDAGVYREQLGRIKHMYGDRLNQVLGFLNSGGKQ